MYEKVEVENFAPTNDGLECDSIAKNTFPCDEPKSHTLTSDTRSGALIFQPTEIHTDQKSPAKSYKRGHSRSKTVLYNTEDWKKLKAQYLEDRSLNDETQRSKKLHEINRRFDAIYGQVDDILAKELNKPQNKQVHFLESEPVVINFEIEENLTGSSGDEEIHMFETKSTDSHSEEDLDSETRKI